MTSRIWQFLVKLSIVGNAILFVILAGGSDPHPSPVQIYPHKPVHLVRDFSSLETQPFLTEVFDAQQLWDTTTGNIIFYAGDVNSQSEYDAIIIDALPNDTVEVPLRAHGGLHSTIFVTTADSDWWGVVFSISAANSGVLQEFKIAALNSFLFFPGTIIAGNRYRTSVHEFGHVLGLDDHNVSGPDDYDGIMDATCCDNFPYDYKILNFPSQPGFADEASCVRQLFDLAGKKRCD